MFNPYGPLPDEGWRQYSYVTIGLALATAGYEVIWWTSNFSHHFKKHRSKGWEDRLPAPGMTIRLVPTPGYHRNIGFGRLLRDTLFGWRAYRRAQKLPAPDVILTSEPATMAGFAGVRLARRTGAALVYDQMDLWPELIVQALPRSLRLFGNLALWPVYRCRRTMFRHLDGVMALARPYLASVLVERTGGRPIPALTVYNGIDVPAFRALMSRQLSVDLAAVAKRPGPKAIFAGSLGPSYDVDAMIRAAAILAERGAEITIMIAGDGPARDQIAAAAAVLPNLIYLGSVAPDVLPSLYAQCDVGLSCYSPRSNVEMCDKFYDYTAAGLAIVNSLTGEVRDWIVTHRLGLQYEAGDGASLAAAISMLAQNSYFRAACQSATNDIAMSFDRSSQHARLPEWIGSVLDGHAHAVQMSDNNKAN